MDKNLKNISSTPKCQYIISILESNSRIYSLIFNNKHIYEILKDCFFKFFVNYFWDSTHRMFHCFSL